MDLQEFRKIFYFLQYQFYLRSDRAARKGFLGMLPQDCVGRFLHCLAEDPDGEHYRWEPRDLIPRTIGRKYGAVGLSIRDRNRLKKQLLTDPGGVPHQSQINRGAVIYRARRRSVRCRFMLFEFPKGFRKDQILSLFRSIIIHDLVKISGLKPWDISRSIIDKNMSELVDNRGKTLWELFSGRCFENEPILRLLDNEHIDIKDCPLETIKSLFFQKLFTNITDTSKSTHKDALGTDKHEHLRKIDQEVLRYLRRAELMTELASDGKFSSFPSHLK